MAKRYPKLEPLKELRHSLSELRLEKLAAGPDHRNRTLLSPFGATTGRNTPSNNRFIFGPSVWLRGLIKPPHGRALAYVDWKSQEVYIAAQLSGDQALLEAVMSGDPYLAFAKMAGLAPVDATKDSHKAIRDLCKTCVLGTNYGMQAQSLALRTGLSVIEAEDLLRRLAQTFPTFTAWAEHVVNIGQLVGHLSTVFGWTLRTENTLRPTTLRNFPMQANGAEMLRLACCLATERGVHVCAPVHDALLVEGDHSTIHDTVLVTRAAMAEASRIVLDGLEVDTDVEIIEWPNRYSDDRGRVMWERVTGILELETKVLKWDPVLLRSVDRRRREHWRPDPSGALRAVSSGREYWLRPCSSGGWRLLIFDTDAGTLTYDVRADGQKLSCFVAEPVGTYVGATNHPCLKDAQDAAEAWEVNRCLPGILGSSS